MIGVAVREASLRAAGERLRRRSDTVGVAPSFFLNIAGLQWNFNVHMYICSPS